jgi:hypothetical protein
MAEGSVEQERARPDPAGDTLLEQYSKQATWHQQRALAEVGRVAELASRGLTSEQQRERLLYALSEALMAWRLLQRAQQEASSHEVAVRLRSRLAKVYSLTESIERAVYAPDGADGALEGDSNGPIASGAC